jgi:hypothetical protein
VLPVKTPAWPPHCPYCATGGRVLVLVAAELVDVLLVVVKLVPELVVVPALLLVEVDEETVLLLDVLVLETVLELETTLPLDDNVPVSLISLELAPTIMLKAPEGMIQA